jgi:predicted acyl esterase
MVRARYREGLDKPKLITPGAVVEYRIKLRPTANEFQAGHRIRLDITSSDFPNYDRITTPPLIRTPMRTLRSRTRPAITARPPIHDCCCQ